MTFRMLLKPKNLNQNWVLRGQMFSWTWLGSALVLLCLSKKRQKIFSRHRIVQVSLRRLLVIELVHRGSSSILKFIDFWTPCTYFHHFINILLVAVFFSYYSFWDFLWNTNTKMIKTRRLSRALITFQTLSKTSNDSPTHHQLFQRQITVAIMFRIGVHHI